jgi:hypothetical protein
MNPAIPKTAANFVTSLASKVASTDSGMTLVSNLDSAGNALSGTFAFTIDEGTVAEEHVIGTVLAMAVTFITRGLDPQDGQTNRSSLQFEHRRGATVKITDHPVLTILARILNGVDTVPNKLSYAAHPAISVPQDIPDKQYVDGVAIAGAPDSSTSVKGIGKVSVAPALSTSPIFVGDNDPRVPTQSENDALVGDNTDIAVGSGNKVVTQTGLQKQAENYVLSTGSANAYVLTLSPIPTSYSVGMPIRFKANFANTGAATVNVNGLGATAIKKTDGATALASGDIANGLIVEIRYDGTNFQLVSPIANLVPSPYTTGLGAWAAATTGSNVQSTTDAMLVFYAAGSTLARIVVKTDSSSTPATVRFDYTNINNASITGMVPVKKNDYYNITVSGTPATSGYFIIPIS